MKRIIKTIIISGLGVFLSYLISFFLTSYISEALGIEAYGFVSIAKNAVSYVGIFSIALTTFIVRYITVSYHSKDFNNTNGYFSSSVYSCLFLSVVIFVASLLVIHFLELILNIPDELLHSVKLLFVLVFINYIFTTISVPFSSSAYIKNRLDIVGYIKIASYAVEAVALCSLFHLFTAEVWFVGLGSCIASIFTFSMYFVMSRILTPELRFKRDNVSTKYIKDLVKNGIWNSLNQIGNTLNSGLDLIVSNLMLSGVETGQIAVVKTFSTIFSTLYATLFQPFQPTLIKSYSEGNMNKFINQLQNAMKFCGCFSNIAFAGFVSLGLLYYQLWLPGEDINALYKLTLLSILLSITSGVMQPVYYVSTLTVKNKIPCWITILGGCLNVVSMYMLLSTTSLGTYAVIGTTTVIMLSINLFFNPIYAAKCLNINPKYFYIVIFRHIVSAFIMSFFFEIIAEIINPNSWGGLILSAMIMSIVGLVVHAMCMFNLKEIEIFFLKSINTCKSIFVRNYKQ